MTAAPPEVQVQVHASTALTQLQRLRERSLPRRVVALPRDPAAHQGAVDELTAALAALAIVGRGPDRQAATKRVEAARVAHNRVAADVEVFTVAAIAPALWDALVAAHPPTDAQAGRGQLWDPAGFGPDALEACILAPAGEAGFTAAHWREFAADGRVSRGEQDLLLATAVALNTRAVQLAVGKGSAPTPS